MRFLAFIILILVPISSFGQTANSEFFPKEQLLNRECIKSDNPEQCLQEFLSKKITSYLKGEENLKLLKNLKKDTLKVTLELNVNKYGNVIDSTSSVRISSFKKSSELSEKIKTSL